MPHAPADPALAGLAPDLAARPAASRTCERCTRRSRRPPSGGPGRLGAGAAAVQGALRGGGSLGGRSRSTPCGGTGAGYAAALYAFHPLPIVESAGQGHLDSLGVALLLAALVYLRRGRQGAGGRRVRARGPHEVRAGGRRAAPVRRGRAAFARGRAGRRDSRGPGRDARRRHAGRRPVRVRHPLGVQRRRLSGARESAGAGRYPGARQGRVSPAEGAARSPGLDPGGVSLFHSGFFARALLAILLARGPDRDRAARPRHRDGGLRVARRSASRVADAPSLVPALGASLCRAPARAGLSLSLLRGPARVRAALSGAVAAPADRVRPRVRAVRRPPGPRGSGARSARRERRRRYRATVAYVGTGFHGWQIQKNAPRTVQAVLHDALRHVAGAPVRVEGASRTDTGVHADGQVVHFDLAKPKAPRSIREAVNDGFPRTCGCSTSRKRTPASTRASAPPGRSTSTAGAARKSFRPATSRSSRLSPRARADLMQDAAARAAGTRDFRIFGVQLPPSESSVRTLHAVSIEESGDELRAHLPRRRVPARHGALDLRGPGGCVAGPRPSRARHGAARGGRPPADSPTRRPRRG